MQATMSASPMASTSTATLFATPNAAVQRGSKALVTSNNASQTPASSGKTVTFESAKSSQSTVDRYYDLTPAKPVYPSLDRLQRQSTSTGTPPNAPTTYRGSPAARPHTTSSLSRAASEVTATSLLRAAPPLSRAAFAKRLRVNSVLFVLYWLVTRTQVYRLASGHLVAFAPSLDTPLHFLESSLLLLLCYNIAESMLRINRLSTLPPPKTRPTPAKTPLSPLKYSSPKTRPSPVARAAPQTPGSPLRTPASPFRTTSASQGSPLQQQANKDQVSPLARSVIGHGAAAKRDESPLIKAYKARHGDFGLAKGDLDSRERASIFVT